jgi:hypothetical protein
MVTMPVPPMPVTMHAVGAIRVGSFGSGRPMFTSHLAGYRCAFFELGAMTVTKLGQKPFTQEKSLLQTTGRSCACGRIRSRPAGSRRSSTARRSRRSLRRPFVDDDALVGIGNVPRLRRRRFSAAQVWS